MNNSCSSLENFLHTVGYLCFFVVPGILIPIGAIHGYGSELYYLYTVGILLFLFPVGLSLLVRAVRLLPVVGAPLADIVVTILRIATHDLCMILNHVATLPGVVEHPPFFFFLSSGTSANCSTFNEMKLSRRRPCRLAFRLFEIMELLRRPKWSTDITP